MSRISPPGNQPIPTNEPKLATQQPSETESVQKTDPAGNVPVDAEQVTKEKAVTTDSKGAQYESRLGGLSRQSELQLHFPIPSEPTLKNLPDVHPNLDPNVHLDEKIDVTKNFPGGHSVKTGLDGLDWGPSKAKTGPGHFGVEMTYGGMKAPTDVLADVRKDGKPSQTSAPPPPKMGNTVTTADGKVGGNSSSTSNEKAGSQWSAPPPGVQLSGRAPNMNLVGETYTQDLGNGAKTVTTVTDKSIKADYFKDNTQVSSFELSKEGVSVGIYNPKGEYEGKLVMSKGESHSYDKKGKEIKMTDPDAGGGGQGVDWERGKVAPRVDSSMVEHGINPDLGVSSGPIAELRKPIDLLKDPIGDEESTVDKSSADNAKLVMDIHGPRTLNPNDGIVMNPKPQGGANSGGDPSTEG